MNKLLRTSLALSIVLFVFSSCSNRISLVKRHYSKGYYIAKTPSISKPQAQKNEANKAITKQSIPTVAVNSGAQSEPSPVNLTSSSTTAIPFVTKNSPKKLKLFSKVQPAVANNNRPLFFAGRKQTFASASVDKEESSMQDEARSLFWIVVVVLIVLWALGLISGSFGLGVIFNLLLVIALVLLLLWLLRVI